MHKYPRLYVDAPFSQNADIDLDIGQSHYLRNVLRKQDGELLRLFNGQNGEWLAHITKLGKKHSTITLEQCVHTQPDPANQQKARLYFSPIKKQRMDILIEKAVELGVTSLHPVLMHRTVLRKINEERIHAQIIEAAEQCKRMDIPELYPVQTFDVLLSNKEITPPLYACIERKSQNETRHLNTYTTGKDTGFLIGPEGGFDDKEVADLLAHKSIIQTSLGETILRAETAAIACLSWAHLTQ